MLPPLFPTALPNRAPWSLVLKGFHSWFSIRKQWGGIGMSSEALPCEDAEELGWVWLPHSWLGAPCSMELDELSGLFPPIQAGIP